MTRRCLLCVLSLLCCALPGFVSLQCNKSGNTFFPLPWTPALPLESTSQCFWFNAYLISSSVLSLSYGLTHKFLEAWADAEQGEGVSGAMSAGVVCAEREVGGHQLCAVFRCRRWEPGSLPRSLLAACKIMFVVCWI